MARRRRILVVEDDKPIRKWVVGTLASAGFDTVEAGDGVAGLEEARRTGVDLVVLDLVMPKMDGFGVLTELRTTHPALPVIIVTARNSEDDRVHGLRSGADDYVVKPFSGRELLARVEAVLRRSPERTEPVVRISVGDTVVDCARREVIGGGPTAERVQLSQREVDILEQLAAKADRPVSREELLLRVWGSADAAEGTRAVDMHIARLRQKLTSAGADAGADSEAEWIVTVRGKGYMLGPSARVDSGGEGSAAQ